MTMVINQTEFDQVYDKVYDSVNNNKTQRTESQRCKKVCDFEQRNVMPTRYQRTYPSP